MARPVTMFPPEGERRRLRAIQEVRQERRRAPDEQRSAALQELYQLLEALHERGTLELLTALVGAGDDIMGRLAEGLAQPESMRAIRDFMELTRLFARIDPDALRRGMERGAELLENRHIAQDDPPGMWELSRRFRTRDARRALAFLAEGLNELGRSLDKSPGRREE